MRDRVLTTKMIATDHSLRNPFPQAGQTRLRLWVSKRGVGDPHPHADLLACGAFVVPLRRPAPNGFLRERSVASRARHRSDDRCSSVVSKPLRTATVL